MSSSQRDSGETSAQVVLVVPVIILILMLAIQAGLYFHTSNVAGAAAAQGATAASSVNMTSSIAVQQGQSSASSFVMAAGAQLFATPLVVVSAGMVSVTVQVKVPRIIPFFSSSVGRSVIEPLERFTFEVNR
jgi:Flp pilus assembly protein TadG